MPVPSRYSAWLRVGADFYARRGAIARGVDPPRGVVDAIAELAHPGIDPARVHPAVLAFFENTAGLELHVRSHWRFPFSVAWRLTRWLMVLLGQFVLPLGEARISTEGFAIAGDGRPGARVMIRRYAETGRVMQVVAYATWTRGGAHYMSAAFPMPFGQILGILRLDPLAEDNGRLAVVLTSARKYGDDAGVRAVVGPLVFRSPFGEHIELWPPAMTGAPGVERPAGVPEPTVVGRHEQRLFGVRFVTHEYWFWTRG